MRSATCAAGPRCSRSSGRVGLSSSAGPEGAPGGEDHQAHHEVVRVRHGETEWSANGRHTSRTDLPLIAEGRARAQALAAELATGQFALVLCSPLRRARETCELA